MDRISSPPRKLLPGLVTALIFAAYVVTFAFLHDTVGDSVSAMAVIPVITAGWYLGFVGGLLMAIGCLAANMVILLQHGHSLELVYQDPGTLFGIFTLLFVAFVVGRFVSALNERRNAISRLELYEKQREEHTRFLELLNEITARALESDSVQSTLRIFTESIAHLFQADDVFFAFWDGADEIPVPAVAYGSLSEVYPYMRFEQHESTLHQAVIKARQPIFVPDAKNSEYITPQIAAQFPSRCMLAIPLVSQDHPLGVLVLGYNGVHILQGEDLAHAELVADQLAVVLSKAQLLEEERRQVRRLTALHDVAVAAVDADSEDQLIERITDIIGQNLFPDNFGILILDEPAGRLRPHSSYRFHMSDALQAREVSLGQGVTGHVALTGRPVRTGNVRAVQEYIDLDDRIVSELAVPIKIKERILGVINAESMRRDAFTADDERLLVTLAGQVATAIEQLRSTKAERVILDQLAHDKELIYSIAQITSQIERSLKADQIIQTMGQELGRIGLTCIMAVYDRGHKTFTVNYTSLPPRLLSIVERGLGYPLVDFVFPLRRLESLLKHDELLRPGVLSDPEQEIKTIFLRINPAKVPAILKQIGVSDGIEPLRLPLAFEENLLGMLWIWGNDVTHSDLPILSIFAKQIGMTLEHARLFEEVKSLALTDPLTGLQNRRSLFELGKIEYSRAQRLGRPFSCMMLDLDHFKRINDQYGHQTGDEVLQQFASRCRRSIREVDLLGRYGGEELIVLLPETNRDLAVHVAERLRAAIAELPVDAQGNEVRLTVSIGVASKDENTPDLEALIARADQAMYIAKHRGRDQVAISI